VLLERAGQLTRIVGPGISPLARFERIRDVINLRPQKYATFKDHATFRVSGMSREGIPVVWPVDVYYQINDQGINPHPASSAKPYAYSDEAVLKASTDRWLRGDEGHDHLEWGDRIVVSDAEGTLRSIMARLPLDRLIRPLDDGAISPRQQVQRELKAALEKGAARHGARILAVDLHDIELEDPVAQQWIETWQAEWKRLATEELAEAKAERVYQLERIKAEAQDMLLAIQDGLDRPGIEQRDLSSDIISMRLIETLQRVASHPRTMSFAGDPDTAIEAWQTLHDLIQSSIDSMDSGDNGPPDTRSPEDDSPPDTEINPERQ
jgi:regulator of protease activity HflC (stomatin/prohibitin superfamily)